MVDIYNAVVTYWDDSEVGFNSGLQYQIDVSNTNEILSKLPIGLKHLSR